MFQDFLSFTFIGTGLRLLALTGPFLAILIVFYFSVINNYTIMPFIRIETISVKVRIGPSFPCII